MVDEAVPFLTREFLMSSMKGPMLTESCIKATSNKGSKNILDTAHDRPLRNQAKHIFFIFSLYLSLIHAIHTADTALLVINMKE